jgi:hypothetical protein
MPEPTVRAAPELAGEEAAQGLRQALLRMTSPGYAALQAEIERLRDQLEVLGKLLDNTEERTEQGDQELREALALLRDQLGELESRLADPEFEIKRVSPVLVPALGDRARQETENFAEAVAPVIGPAIRHQIRESKADIIDSLYPLIGQIIGKSVSESIRELARNIDLRLRQQLDFRTRLRRMAGRLKGVSEAELILREALPYTIQHIFLIHRQSGLLLQHLSRSGEEYRDSDLISGMLTAIQSFVRDSFGRGEEELEEVAYGDERILLESGQYAYLAVVLDGIEPQGYNELLREITHHINLQFEPALSRFNGEMDRLPDFREQLRPLLEPGPTGPVVEAGKGGAPAGALTRNQKIALAAGLGGLLLLAALIAFQCIFTYRLWSVAFPGPSPTPTAAPTDLPAVLPSFTPTIPPTASPTPSPTLTATPSPMPSPTTTSTPAASPTLEIYQLTGNLYVRSGPGSSFPNVGTILFGEEVVVVEKQGEWFYIRWPAEGETVTEGWAWSRFIAPAP